MARKGILASDPSIKDMTPARWMFEHHAAMKKDREYIEVFATVLKNVMVSVFGLNIIRPEDGNGNPVRHEDLTEEQRKAFIPLVAWVGNSEMLKKAHEQASGDEVADKALTNKAYEEQVAAIDAAMEAGGDMEPIIGFDNDIPDGIAKRDNIYKGVTVLDAKDINIDGEY